MKSLLAFALLLVFCSAQDDRALAFAKRQFELFEKFIEHKDRESASTFISPIFGLKLNCNDKRIKKDEFMRRVFNMASSPNPFHVEVLDAKNQHYHGADFVYVQLKIHGFGEPFIIYGHWIFDRKQNFKVFIGGSPMNC